MQYQFFEIQDFLQQYVFIEQNILGKGYDANVYLVWNQKDKSQQFALKCSNFRDQQHIYNFYNEIQILQFIKHPHILEYYGNSKDLSCILLEYMPYGNLQKIIQNGIDMPIVKGIMLQLLSVVNHLHSHNVVHGDLKPENTLISQQFQLKVCDFGFAKYLKTPDTKLRGGSEGFTAPEVHMPMPYDAKKCDIFALGVMLFIFTFGLRPFISNHPSKEDQYWRLIKTENWDKFWLIFQKAKPVSDEFKICFQAMVHPQPDKRVGIQQLCQLQWWMDNKCNDDELIQFLKNRLKIS